MLLFIFFFFSSRRRHTRFDCDWSSDVCSSDLPLDEGPDGLVLQHILVAMEVVHRVGRALLQAPQQRVEREGPHTGRKLPRRSEEHTSELQSQSNLVCRLLLEKKKKKASVEAGH